MEDHDDLMPVFAAQSDLLSATYGEFFLADMIELQDSNNKASQVLVLFFFNEGSAETSICCCCCCCFWPR